MIECQGAKFNEVAELSGIDGTPHHLRTAGSGLAKHPKVKRLYELALLAKREEEAEIAYPPELLKQLSGIARNDTSTNDRLKANELFLKCRDRFQEHSRLCDMRHPVFVILAMHYAGQLAA